MPLKATPLLWDHSKYFETSQWLLCPPHPCALHSPLWWKRTASPRLHTHSPLFTHKHALHRGGTSPDTGLLSLCRCEFKEKIKGVSDPAKWSWVIAPRQEERIEAMTFQIPNHCLNQRRNLSFQKHATALHTNKNLPQCSAGLKEAYAEK